MILIATEIGNFDEPGLIVSWVKCGVSEVQFGGLGSVVRKLWFGIYGLESVVWELRLGICGLGSVS